MIEPDASEVMKQATNSGVLGYLWLVMLAVWGGTSSYISRIRKAGTPFSIVELIGEWTISGFAGVITAYACYYLKWDFYLIAAATGIAGHMGGRAIYMLENVFTKRFGNASGS